jgi:hypothetical protein
VAQDRAPYLVRGGGAGAEALQPEVVDEACLAYGLHRALDQGGVRLHAPKRHGEVVPCIARHHHPYAHAVCPPPSTAAMSAPVAGTVSRSFADIGRRGWRDRYGRGRTTQGTQLDLRPTVAEVAHS